VTGLQGVPDFNVTLEILEQSYANEPDDPLYVWEAILYCLTGKVPMPEWVQVYLEEIAEDLLAIRKVGKRGGDEIKRALKIQKLDLFDRHIRAQDKERIFRMVQDEVLKRKDTNPDVLSIFADVASRFKPGAAARDKKRYSEEKIKQTYYELKRVHDKQAVEDREQERILWKEDLAQSDPPEE
jgi:hypothetical protein